MPNQSERGYDYRYDSDNPRVYEGSHTLVTDRNCEQAS